MRPFSASNVAAGCALVVLALAGCGGEEGTTTAATGADDAAETSTAGHGDPGAGAEGGPTGALTAEGIGDVEVGASEDEVRAAFGEPVEAFDVDLGGGPGEAPQLTWLYRFPTGDVAIKFDTRDDTFAAYDVHTQELETEDGIKVGDPRTVVEERYGDELAESPLGLDSLVLSASAPGTAEGPALTFAFQEKRILAISGGDPVQPAGE